MPWFPREAGAYAEYVTAPSRHFAAKPHALSFEEAAALPLAGLTAWQIVVDAIALQDGDDILIHGAAGGVGHLAVQIAKARGANVFATARAEQAEWLRELGADEVIDYRDGALRGARRRTRRGDRLPRRLRRALARACCGPAASWSRSPSGVAEELPAAAKERAAAGHRLPGRARPGRPRRARGADRGRAAAGPRRPRLRPRAGRRGPPRRRRPPRRRQDRAAGPERRGRAVARFRPLRTQRPSRGYRRPRPKLWPAGRFAELGDDQLAFAAGRRARGGGSSALDPRGIGAAAVEACRRPRAPRSAAAGSAASRAAAAAVAAPPPARPAPLQLGDRGRRR